MYVLTESEWTANLSALGDVWHRPESFVLLPDKAGLSRAWLSRGLEQVPPELSRDHFGLLTSGTTGQPKVIIGSRGRAENLAVALHQLQQSEPVRRTVLLLPLSYTFAFVNQWVWSVVHKRGLVPTRGFGDPEGTIAALETVTDAMLCLVGAQIPLLAGYLGNRSLPGILRVHFAGGRFPQESLDVVRTLFPNALIFNNYGCAEAMPRLTLRRAEDSEDPRDIGKPLPGVELRTSAEGELQFRSPYSAVGVIGPDGYRSITPGSWLGTGDLAEPTPSGTWRLVGRSSEVFKRYGERISLSQLMSTVNESWRSNAVFYRETDHSGEEGHVLLLAPSPTEAELHVIQQAFRTNHTRVFWPLRIESVDSFPLLPNGKVDVLAASTLPHRTIHWYQRI
jgi:acyl-CoA synthetase (AMP-forming)/AMP-acid ligase II